MNQRVISLDRPLWSAALTLALADALAVWLLGWTVDPAVPAAVAVAVIGLSAIAWVAAKDARLARLSAPCLALALLCLLSNGAWIATFVGASMGAPLRDATYAAADRALGFSWAAWKAWSVAHPSFDRVTQLAYGQHIWQSVVLLALLANGPRGASPLLRALLIAFIVTLAISAVAPAIGTEADAEWLPTFIALRSGTFRHIGGAQALISMPSFHAVLATLFALGWWTIPWARWPGLAFNALMLVATVRWGQHYLVDVLAGVLLAIVAARATAMLSRSDSSRPSPPLAEREAPTVVAAGRTAE
jgi:membrane-associated phospholipid phosphatase